MNDIKTVITNLNDCKDSFGLFVQLSGDGGDSLQRNSHYWLLRQLSGYNPGNFNFQAYNGTMDKFEIRPGIYVRHPDGLFWWADYRNCSRDQISVAIQAMTVMNDKSRLKRVTWALIKRFGFHQNYLMGTDIPTEADIESTISKLWPNFIRNQIIKLKTNLAQYRIPDIIAPGELATIIRGLNLWILYPLLLLLDLFLLGDLYFRKNASDYDNMLASQMMVSNYKLKTPIAVLAKKFYAKTDYKERIIKYYEGGLPLLGELYVLVCEAKIE